MKTLKFKWMLATLFMVAAIAMFAGVDSGIELLIGGGATLAMAGAIVGPGVEAEGTVTMETLKGGDSILDDDLNKMIVKVRPSDTPLDTLTRELKNTRKVARNECGGYEIGTRDVIDIVLAATDGLSDVANLSVSKKGMWQKSDTISLPAVLGGDGFPLMLYVVSKNAVAGTLQVIAANPVGGKIPVIPEGAALIRLSKAMSEVDAQTDAFAALPTTRTNYTQIHMTQVEESVIADLMKKNVVLDFSTHKELAIWDMKRAMEYTNLFGVKSLISDPESNKPVYTSAGIWNQIPNRSTYDKSKAPTNADFVNLTKEIFEGNNGSERRVVLAGVDYIKYLSQIEAYSKQMKAESVEVVHGVRFNRIITNFGELLVKPMSGLFVGPHTENALVVDPSYIVKYVLEPLQTTELELDKTGVRRVNAVRLLENYALFAENTNVHRRITPQ